MAQSIRSSSISSSSQATTEFDGMFARRCVMPHGRRHVWHGGTVEYGSIAGLGYGLLPCGSAAPRQGHNNNNNNLVVLRRRDRAIGLVENNRTEVPELASNLRNLPPSTFQKGLSK